MDIQTKKDWRIKIELVHLPTAMLTPELVYSHAHLAVVSKLEEPSF